MVLILDLLGVSSWILWQSRFRCHDTHMHGSVSFDNVERSSKMCDQLLDCLLGALTSIAPSSELVLRMSPSRS